MRIQVIHDLLASELDHALSLQEAGRFDDIWKHYDESWRKIYDDLPEDADEEDPLFLLGFAFWDDWAAAAEHDWEYHEPVGRDDWPRMARIVIDALRYGTPIEDEFILKQFTPKPEVSFWSRIKGLWGRKT